jgi:Straboviridae DNA helicase loader
LIEEFGLNQQLKVQTEKLTPFEAYKTYLTVKTYFTRESFKFGRKVNVKYSTFEKRKDRYFFTKLAKYKKRDLVHLLVANLVYKDESVWVKNLLDEQSEEIYINWKKRIESISYEFQDDCNTLKELLDQKQIAFTRLFKIKSDEHPMILRLLLGSHISLETFVLLNLLFNFFPSFNSKLVNDEIWQQIQKKCLKYQPFIPVDKYSLRNIIRNTFIKE